MVNEKEYFVLYTPENLERAYYLLNYTFDRNIIFSVLKENDDIKKEAALLNLADISSYDEAMTLVSVLTGQSGPVREICSFKINEFIHQTNMRKFFVGDKILEQLLDALNDIVPSVVRNIIDVLPFIYEKDIFLNKLLCRIIAINIEEENSEPLSGHEITKNTFKLYWYMEALSEFSVEFNLKKNITDLSPIFEKTCSHSDYTIREKAAKLLSRIDGYESYKSKLINDVNPYVYHYLK